eukprot:TRINITY_DN15549_c0_g1_i3.p1 TRINITY_DN15549_c0_g1~~TRINITY_DN15549_c0_g1_i3.p1  ORF type:complete len:357 (+),score=98.49 TRINITY_DN15549_c0_g1_i3:102-1172(+)
MGNSRSACCIARSEERPPDDGQEAARRPPCSAPERVEASKADQLRAQPQTGNASSVSSSFEPPPEKAEESSSCETKPPDAGSDCEEDPVRPACAGGNVPASVTCAPRQPPASTADKGVQAVAETQHADVQAEALEVHEKPEVPAGARVVSKRRSWLPGEEVERLLDDITDIWLGAEIVSVRDDGMYDIKYVDNGSVETAVEECELRRRKFRLDFPAEVWEHMGACLHQKLDLCGFEVVARATSAASQRKGENWWCAAYHERFGRCGPRCSFARLEGEAGAEAFRTVVASCQAASSSLSLSAEKVTWKARYIDQEQHMTPAVSLEEDCIMSSRAESTFSPAGKRAKPAAQWHLARVS